MITVDSLVRRASAMTNVTVAQIYGPSHKRYICAVRCAVYIVAKEHGVIVTQIARRMERDHSTIINAINSEPLYRLKYPQLPQLIQSLRNGDDTPCPFVKARRSARVSKPSNRYTEDQLEQIDRLVHEGVNMMDIAEQLGKTHDSVASARTKWLKKHPERKQKREWPAGRLERVIELRQDGMLWRDIGKVMGVPSETLRTGAIRVLPQSHLRSVLRSGSNRPDRQCRPT